MSYKGKYKLNYKFSKKDSSAFRLKMSRAVQLPPSVNLANNWGEIYDQGQLGSCASNSAAGVIRYCVSKNDQLNFSPSRLYIYYNGRTIEGYDITQDGGLTISDAFQSVNQYKVCPESDWPYDISQFAVKPPQSCYDEAMKMNSDFNHYSLNQDLVSLKTCLYDGYPISYGMTLFQSFESDAVASTGQVPMPDPSVEQEIGGHALSIVGYDDNTQMFTVANSWSSQWGANGFCYIPYSYILNQELASDFWTVRTYNINKQVNLISIVEEQINAILQNNSQLEQYVKNAVDDMIKKFISTLVNKHVEKYYK